MSFVEPWILILLLVNGDQIEVLERHASVSACALDAATRMLEDELIDRFACVNEKINKCGEAWSGTSVFGDRPMICVAKKDG
jgi:hypothetical protein